MAEQRFLEACGDLNLDVVSELIDTIDSDTIDDGLIRACASEISFPTDVEDNATENTDVTVGIAKILLERGANPECFKCNECEFNAIGHSFGNSQFKPELVHMLLKSSKLGLSFVDEEGQSYAWRCSSIESYKFAFENGVDMTTPSNGRTILDLVIDLYENTEFEKKASELEDIIVYLKSIGITQTKPCELEDEDRIRLNLF